MIKALIIILALFGSISLAQAVEPIKIGDLFSYTAFANYGKTYKQGWELALEEINVSGGVLGRPLEVISRDTRGNPADAIVVAQELINRDEVFMLMGTIYSHIGLAVSSVSRREKVPFIAAFAATNKLVWGEGHRYVARMLPPTYGFGTMLAEKAAKLPIKRWALLFPNYEFGHDLANSLKIGLKKLRPDVEFVSEQWPALGKLDAGSTLQALMRSKPEGLLMSLLGGDLPKFIRETRKRGVDLVTVGHPVAFPEDVRLLGDEYPIGWYAAGLQPVAGSTGLYPKFYKNFVQQYKEEPGIGSVIGYLALHSIAKTIQKVGKLDREAFIDNLPEIKMDYYNGNQFFFRKEDLQSSMGFYIGKTTIRDGVQTLEDASYAPGDKYFLPVEEVLKLRKGK